MHALKRELETLFVILLASSIAIFFMFYNGKSRFLITAPIPAFLESTKLNSSITPTPTTEASSWTSSDGKMQVSMEKRSNTSDTTYTFYVSQTSETDKPEPPLEEKLLLFTKTVDSNTTFSIPYNTFSPDDKYLFLQENRKDTTRFLVFNASGKPFANGETYLDVSSLFEKHTSDYVVNFVTGWAAETLLIVRSDVSNKNTNATDAQSSTPSNTRVLTASTKPSGPSFWLDVPSQSFTQLSTRF